MVVIRRFVNKVAEDYKRGLYSLHRLDVSKHLVYPSAAEAQANTGGGDEIERLQELPAPCICMQPALTTVSRDFKTPFFGLLSPSRSESMIFSINEVGQSALFNADEQSTDVIPDLEEFKGRVHVSASIVDQAGAKKEGTYIMHGLRDGLDFKSRFDVLRFGNPSGGGLRTYGGWYWQSLPLPPFIYGSHKKTTVITSYTVVEDGRTICLSSMEGSTYCFNTAKGEWWQAGDWMLPFDGRAVYVPEHKFWLGFCLRNPNNLCATSGLAEMALNQPPKVQILWENLIPDEWVAIKVNLVNLGSGKFVIAKVFKDIRESSYSDWDMIDDEFVVLTGVEIICDNLQGLQVIQHKSIRYMCANNRILQVL